MASSSSKPRRSYHVFLSFRGPDVRNHFLSHLYSALDQAGIRTYKDDEKLRNGEEIPHALMNAIKDSQVAIIIFSENYASSSWCLDELTKIIECRKQKDLIVWPVFYKVEPYEVRTPRESYRKALDKHEIKFRKDSEKVKRWKEALFYASFLSGEHFTDGSEAVLVQRIVREISTQLGRMPLNATKSLVGIDSRVQELKSILNLQSEGDVLMVGLCGQGGVGKSTLAEAIYNATFRNFLGSCFLGRIKDNSNDLAHLQEKLLSKLLPGDKLMVASIGEGSQLIQERLCNKKVLIILDDVDDRHQLVALAEKSEWFGKGSRIIITTRYQRLVTSHWKDSHCMYKVKTLNNGQALELFRRHASLSNQNIEMRRNLVDRILHYARGLPLALEVLGCSLRDREEKEWEETLEKLADSPDQEINNVLRVSWDPLEDNDKQIFLDIACFFKGQSTKYITKVLSSCGFYTTIGLRNLIERSLISEENGTLQMHDLMQLMGMDIVKEERRDYPEKRSRLWLHDDVLDVLSRNGGTKKIKAIVLKLPKRQKMHIGPHAFTNMRKLRLLIMHNVDNSCQDPIHLPRELRWFEWPHCASPPDFRDASKNLVGLDMRGSNIKGLGQFKDFEKLKIINFGYCQSLVCMPDLSYIPNLEELNLYMCKNLERVHDSIANHCKLRELNLEGCHLSEVEFLENLSCPRLFILKLSGNNFTTLPTLERLNDLEELEVSNCQQLQEIPKIPRKLRRLEANDCKSLTRILSNIYDVGDFDLEELEVSNCQQLQEIPKIPRKLRRLFANNCESLTRILSDICDVGDFDLEELDVSNCQQLQEIPKIPRKLRILEANNCKSLTRILSDICDIGDFDLEELDVSNCQQLQVIPKIPRKLRILEANNCKSLTRILPDIWDVGDFDLEELDVSNCQQLQEIPNILRKLRRLYANNCESLTRIFSNICDVGDFDLEELDVSNCQQLQEIPKIPRKLRRLKKFHCQPNRRVVLPGGEMPKWLLPNKEGYISFVASKDLYEKILGVAFCVVFQVLHWSGESTQFEVIGSVNGKATIHSKRFKFFDLDNVWLEYMELKDLWTVEHFGPNDLTHFRISIRVCNYHEILAKKCGFRLICKPLENDIEILLQDEQLLDPALFYEVSHEDNPMSTKEKGLNMVDSPIERHRYSSLWSVFKNVSPRREMPQGFVLVEDGSIFQGFGRLVQQVQSIVSMCRLWCRRWKRGSIF